jgi:hypothetical protein
MPATLDYIFDGPMVHDDDDRFLTLLERSAHEVTRQGPAPDDIEATAPFIGMMPEESRGEEPSPLDFGHWREIDLQIIEAMRSGAWDIDLFRKDVEIVPPTFEETMGIAHQWDPAPSGMLYPYDADGQTD